jgi:hypothetical protein
MCELFLKLFKSKWTPYTYLRDEVVKEEIYENKYSDLMMNDPMDMGVIPTGIFVDVTYEIWVRTNIRTGLPNYKRIRK